MAFTVRDFDDLIRLLDKHPNWLEALRQRLLTKELLQSPKTLQRLSTRVGKVEKGLDSLREAIQTLTQSVTALAEAQRRTEERVGRLEEAVTALAEAQRRHYEEFVAHRAETDRRFAELAEAQRRHYEEFVAHRAETDRRFAELAEAQRRTEERVARLEEAVTALAEAQRRTEAQIQELIRHQRQMQSTLDRFAQVIGPAVEERMIPALKAWVEGSGGTLTGPVVSMALDGIGVVDGVVRVRWPEGQEGWVLISVRAKVWPRGIREFVEGILQNPEARAALRARGVEDPVWPVVFGLTADERALETAKQEKVGLLLSHQGIIVPPVPWSIEQGSSLPE